MAQYRNPRGTDPHYHDVVNEIFDFYINQISAICGVTKQELKSSSKMAHICLGRHALCYMLRKHHSAMIPLQEIGRYLNRHHSSIVHSVDLVLPDHPHWRFLKKIKPYSYE